jgi:hypothetical protein
VSMLKLPPNPELCTCGELKSYKSRFCIDCKNADRRDKYNADPDTTWRRNLRRQHGMSVEEYMVKFDQQRGLCASCFMPEKDTQYGRVQRLCIDHDHTCCPPRSSCPQCRRGLLCASCNKMLGYAHDDPQALLAAAHYLERFSC